MPTKSTHETLAVVALNCLRDLGITLIYAVVAGLLIVAIVTSDHGPISLLRALAYAAILPGAVFCLIALEVGLSVLGEWRSGRRQAQIRATHVGLRPSRS